MNSKQELFEFNTALLSLPRDGLKIYDLSYTFSTPDKTLVPQEWGYINIKSKVKQWQNYYLNMASVGEANRSLAKGEDGYFTFFNNEKAQGKKHCLLDCTIKEDTMIIRTRASEPMSRLPMDLIMIRDYIIPFLKRDINKVHFEFDCISFLPNYIWVLVNLGLDPSKIPPKVFGSTWDLIYKEAQAGYTENNYHSYQRQLINFMRSDWFTRKHGRKDLITPEGIRKWDPRSKSDDTI